MTLQLPPGSSPIPGTTAVPAAPATPPSGVTVFAPPERLRRRRRLEPVWRAGPGAARPRLRPPHPARRRRRPTGRARDAGTSGADHAAGAAAVAAARVTVSPPSEMRVGSGPHTVPVSITGASRLTGVTISITFNPALLRVRNVSEGTLMRQGGATPAFTQQVDAAAGRIDIAIVRPGDQVGVSATGLLAAILFDPVSAGTATLAISGSGTTVGGGVAALQFAPAGVVVR